MSYLLLPSNPGVYLFLNKKGDVLYVGKAKNLKKRVSSYFTNPSVLGPKTEILVSQVKKIRTILAHSEIEALLLEAEYIKLYKPKYNTKLADGKAYPFIRITINDKYPKVLIERRENDKNSIYFGPFPNASAMRLVLKLARKIFPFQSTRFHPKKICFYYHLGLCPCASVFDSKEVKKEYGKSINHLIQFLRGNSKKLIREFGEERNVLAKNEEFEKAAIIQKKMESVEIITSSYYERFDSDINPNLKEDKNIKAVSEFKKHLFKNNIKVDNLERIECYDISNASGTLAVGSMVVFINGVENTSLYRKFKIKTLPPTPNDFAMLKEIILRRLNHIEWEKPDLIIVDGGKGQVSSAIGAIKEKNMIIPVIGIAKREEIIIASDFKEIKLPKSSEALKLVMRIRDEAHRFAILYHRKLREKNLFPDNVINIRKI